MIAAQRNLLHLLFAILGSTQANSTEPPPLVLTHLDLEIRLDYDRKTLEGTARLNLRNSGEAPVREVPLQIGRLMTASAAFGPSGSPVPFAQDVVVFADWPTYQVNQLRLTLPAAISPGEVGSVEVRYGGTLVGYVEAGMLYVRDRIDPDFTILRSESRAFPVVAVPSLAAMRRAPRQDFTFELRLNGVPAAQKVVTGTSLVAVQGSTHFTNWLLRSQEPVPFLNVCIAPYRPLSSKSASVYFFREDSLGARRVQSAIDRCLDLYARWFGPLESEHVLQVMEIPEGWGSQASLTAGIMQTADAFRDGRELVQLYHELAHLWHPRNLDLPSPRWDEGLAMFLQQRVAVVLDEAEALESFMQSQADRLTQQLRESETLRSIPMADYGKHDLTGFSYRTGRLFFYALFALLGADEFDRILGEYFRAFRARGSTTEDFVAFVESGTDVSLQPLVQDWLYTTEWAARLGAGEPLERIVASYR